MIYFIYFLLIQKFVICYKIVPNVFLENINSKNNFLILEEDICHVKCLKPCKWLFDIKWSDLSWGVKMTITLLCPKELKDIFDKSMSEKERSLESLVAWDNKFEINNICKYICEYDYSDIVANC